MTGCIQRILDYLDVTAVLTEKPNIGIQLLQSYEGVYDAPESFPGKGPFVPELTNDGFIFKTPNSNDYKLVPETQRKFNIAGTRLFVEFISDGDSKVVSG